MRKLFFVFVIFIPAFAALSFYFLQDRTGEDTRDIVVQFVTYNDYGNNLYIDNVLTGIQNNDDIAVTSIFNIPYDTTYSVYQSGTDTVSPIVTVSNIGRNAIPGTVAIHLSIEPGGYFDTDTLPQVQTGQSTEMTFAPFIYKIGTPYYFKAYVSYEADTNHVNDTLFQYSIILPGYERNVLYEEVTSDSSASCANNNGFLDAFVNTNIEKVTAIKYHTNLLGRDTFYVQNPVPQDARRRYYFTASVPTTLADGKITVSVPYGDSVNLYRPYFSRLEKGTPVTMSVTDERIGGDSIRTTVNVNIISAMRPGDYRLRLCAVERLVVDSLENFFNNPFFYDVFREMYPDTNGIFINTAPGTYQYEYTYYRAPGWVDSMIYTAAFIQDDKTKEVYNCAKGRNIVLNEIKQISTIRPGKTDPLNVSYQYKGSLPYTPLVDSIQTTLNVEMFEAYFPPIGWKLFNQDGYITFDKCFGANGPSLGGSHSVLMDFFDYNIIGSKDSIYSKVYSGLLSIDTIRFDYAYAQYSTFNVDSLVVNISTDGGLTFPYEIFRKGGLQLATAPQITSFFIPQNATQWRTYKYSLDGIVSVNNNFSGIPLKFTLNQNFPNPFNPSTVITYELPVSSDVSLNVYDVTGRLMTRLVNEMQRAGKYEVSFDGKNLSSGVYFYQILTDGFADTKRMVLVK